MNRSYQFCRVLFICSLVLFGGLPSPAKPADQQRNSVQLSVSAKTIGIQQISKKYKKDGSEFKVQYPKFIGSNSTLVRRLNEAVSNIWAVHLAYDMEGGTKNYKRPGSQFSGRYELGFLSEKTVSIRFIFSHYYAGTAHGETHFVQLNRNLPDLSPLELGDILGGDVGNYSELRELLCEKLKKENELDVVYTDAVKLSPKDGNFTVTAKGLRWDYGIYELGSAILGCPSATISFAELEADPSMNGFAKWQTANGLRKNPKAVVLGAKCED